MTDSKREPCPECGKPFNGRRCRCGYTVAAGKAGPRLCPVDGAVIEVEGWCPRGGGYPLGQKNPETCPTCRRALDWDGGCSRCYGVGLAPEDPQAWVFPGRRYRLVDGHFILVDRAAMRRACTPEENRRAARVVLDLSDRRITRDEAHRRLDGIFGGRQRLDPVEQQIEDERDAQIQANRLGTTPTPVPVAWEPGADDDAESI